MFTKKGFWAMTCIKIKRGLDIPIAAAPSGDVRPLDASKQIAFPFTHFDDTKFHVLVRPGDSVKIGQPLVQDKDLPERKFVSPAAGTVQEVRRGEKRRLQAIVIDVAQNEEHIQREPKEILRLSSDQIVTDLLEAGLFAHIRVRPFNRLANPKQLPRSIFVKAIESAPFVTPAEMQVQGFEKEFQQGLAVLKKLTQGPVQLVYREKSLCKTFSEAQGVEKHTVNGPHPAGNASVHIHYIDPIRRVDDVVWTVTVTDVISIGSLFLHGKISLSRIVALAGDGVLQEQRGYYRARFGTKIEDLFKGKYVQDKELRFISGDVLTGDKVSFDDFLGFSHTGCFALFESTTREFLPFMRLGADKYTASGAYLSGHMNPETHKWQFTTSQHGEERGFIDGSVYERVMPMRILPLQLTRAVMSEDFELAEQLGLLEVDYEDFALPEFVDPSKSEMMDIIKTGLKQYQKDTVG
jgi:Na+-transporting NADH:ubiquinone oxidoreductase subunit A